MKLFRTPDFRREFLAQQPGRRMLDLGCGAHKTPGATGVDHFDFPGVDVVHNLDQFPYPFADGSFDAVVLNHVVEHLGDIPATLAEVRRILAPGGVVWIATPHFTDASSWTDPTHKFHLGIGSFAPVCNPPTPWFTMERAYVTLKGGWWKDIGYEQRINRDHGPHDISPLARKWEDKQCFRRRGGEMFFVLKKT